MNETPDLVVFNGKITTMDAALPETTAFAARDGRFVAVGTDKDVVALKGKSTTVVDLHGRRVIPGLIDNHMHLIRGGLFYNLELRWDGVRSLAQGMQMLREQIARTPPAALGARRRRVHLSPVPREPQYLTADLATARITGRQSLTGLALAHGYDTAFWSIAGIFAGGAVIGGVLLRRGPLGQKRTPSPASGAVTVAQAGASPEEVR